MRFALLLGLAAVVAVPTHAQSPVAQRRRGDIARVQELVTDPDPLQRPANFEEIAAEGDAVKLQTAVRVALTGNDQMLRGLAFRALIGGVQRFVAELSLDPAMQQRIDRARSSSDRNAMREVRDLTWFAEATAMRADFRITQFALATGRGKARIGWWRRGQEDVDFQVVGDRFLATVGIDGSQITTCSVELRPTRELRIEGHMACQGATFGRVAFSAPMF